MRVPNASIGQTSSDRSRPFAAYFESRPWPINSIQPRGGTVYCLPVYVNCVPGAPTNLYDTAPDWQVTVGAGR